MKIFDAHAHIFPDALAEKATASILHFYDADGYVHRSASLSCLLREHDEAGITGGILCNSAVTPEQVHNINDFIAASIRANPRYLGFGSVYPGMDGVEDELDRMLELGLRGIKIHPDFQRLCIDDPSATDTYRAIAKRGLPVLFHMGDAHRDFSTPGQLLNLLRQVPDLRVIAAHFGGWQTWEISLANPMPENVVYDTSSSTPLIDRELTLRLIDRFGEDRLLFGTDFPMWKPSEMIEQIKALRLGKQTEKKLFSENFMRFFSTK